MPLPYENKRVLLCDDDSDITQVYEIMLREMGFEVTIRHDAESCLSLAHDNVYDLLILDVNLPGMSGLILLDEIRETRRNAHSKVITITARQDEQDMEACLTRGADGFLSKPISTDDFFNAVRQVMGGGAKTVMRTREELQKKNFERLEQRRFHRQEINEPVIVSPDPEGDYAVDGTLLDISADGLRLSTMASYYKGVTVYIQGGIFKSLELPIAYTIAWCRLDPFEGSEYGLQLQANLDHLRPSLQQLVNRYQIASAQKE